MSGPVSVIYPPRGEKVMSGDQDEVQTARRKTRNQEGEAPLDPRVEHLKQKAFEKERRQKAMQPSGKFYTEVNGKIILKSVKPNGVYSTYVGKVKKHKEFIDKAKKEGHWVEPSAVEEKEKQLLEKAQAEFKQKAK